MDFIDVKQEVNMQEIVFERLKVYEKKRIRAGTGESGQTITSNAGCAAAGVDDDLETEGLGSSTLPITVLNGCLINEER